MEEDNVNGITLGDLQIIGKKPIKNPTKIISSLLKNKTIRDYLKIYDLQKTISKTPTYID